MADILTSPTLSPSNVTYCPNGTKWILSVFGDCAITARDHASVYVGMVSMACYVACAFPQYYEACKSRKMHEAMSMWFLLLWALIDSCNAAGVFLADQLPLQKYLSIYFILIDSVMIIIYFYFKFHDRRPKYSAYAPIRALYGFVLLGSMATFSLLQQSEPAVLNPRDVTPSRRLLSAHGDEEYSIRMKIGFTFGLITTMMCIIYRIPQIITNFRRKSVEGLALGTFLLMMAANICLGLSIAIKSPMEGQTEAIKALHHLPWLICCAGSFCFDCILMSQFFHYQARTRADEKLPLLKSTDSLYS
uniref:Mgc69309 protein n=1 Tax=Xenopus tropicalis TaxID=8364 RepID=A0A6I8QSJ1_XENTR